MRGGTRKRGETWTWFFDAVDPATGKRRQRSKGGFRTKREAQAALSEALAAYRGGTLVEPSKLTLGALLDEWLLAMTGNLEPNTHETYGHYAAPTSSPGSGTSGCSSSPRPTFAGSPPSLPPAAAGEAKASSQRPSRTCTR
jgi:hypothetical protein